VGNMRKNLIPPGRRKVRTGERKPDSSEIH
jgi:hypothetical protein